MFGPKRTMFVFVVVGLAVIAPGVHAQEAERSEREAMYYRYLEFPSYVKGGSITLHWMADGWSFWYAEGAPVNTVVWKVDPRANTKTPLFDTARLRRALTPLLGHEPPYQGLSFEEFTFVDGEKTVKFTVENKEFILQLDTYAITRTPALSEEEKRRLVPKVVRKARFPGADEDVIEVPSPDGRWFVGVKDYNLWLRSALDGRLEPLTADGVKEHEWVELEVPEATWAWWSPDSSKLAVKKEDRRKVGCILVVDWLKPTEAVEFYPTTRSGGTLPELELFVMDILSKRGIRVDTGDEPDQDLYILGWRPDGSELLFLKTRRGGKKLDLMAANAATGATRLVLSETQHIRALGRLGVIFRLLADGERFIWMSEGDGWNHLYLYNIDGTLIRQLTKGNFPVVRVVAVDEKAGWVYFTAHGDQQRPYDTHLYRVSLEGKGCARLTEATGQHAIQFAPSKQFFLDTHSTVARPPVVELRRADGTLVQILSQADVDRLTKELKWRSPEEFVVKAADGKTGLYGVLYKPYDFDPNKQYPVVEVIHGGPSRSAVPKSFTDYRAYFGQAPALAQLGFITFMVDGRGTPERGREFHAVAYGSLGRHEVPDHVAALKQLAEKRLYMDLGRVGVYGHSWGGHFALRALLLAPDVYHVGVASAPDVDLYDHTAGEPELYMGLPQNNKEGYDYASNLWLAGNLQGELLLIHGTSDVHVPFSATMKMVEAFIRASKSLDLIVLPGETHFFTETSARYVRDAVRRYFQEHLKP